MKLYWVEIAFFWLKVIGVVLVIGSCTYFCVGLEEEKREKILNSAPNYRVTESTIIIGSSEIAFKYVTRIEHTRGLLRVYYDYNQGSSFGYVNEFLIKPQPFLRAYRSYRR